MEIGQKIKEERQRKKWTQGQLAEEILVSKRTITNWETGKTVPDIESVIRLAKLFQLSLDDLLLEDSAVVKEIQRKEQLVKMRGVYYLGPILTSIIILAMMYLPLELFIQKRSILWSLAFVANLVPLFYFQTTIDRLKNKKVNWERQIKQTKVVGTAIVVFVCIFLIYLYFI